jgi:MGT family glycosyltransferase
MNQTTIIERATRPKSKARLKILFANIPADGHFYPLTSLAVHLKEAGHDVRWYTGPSFTGKISKLGIPYYLFNKAKEVTVHNIDEVFPQRKKIRNHIKKVSFDICSYFIERGEEFYEDIRDINDGFNFDVLIADNCFTGISFTRKLLKKEVVAIGVLPLNETSKDLPPTIMGLTPFTSPAGKRFQAFLRYITDNFLLKGPNEMMRRIHGKYGIDTGEKNIMDAQVMMTSLYLQSGTPGFEYHRSDLSRHIHFIGPLLPLSKEKIQPLDFEEKLSKYGKVILVTQGTFENDHTKLLIPTLEAYKNSDFLVVATTAGWHTKELQEKYRYDNIVIKDFIPFSQIMPYADVFVSNGGYGGVTQSITNTLPMVVGGIHEGKNEICARVGYFNLGINLKTERPSISKIRKAVATVLADKSYQKNTERLAKEFKKYHPQELCEQYLQDLLVKKAAVPA